ncbi:alpha/beta fold hydrolase [Acinetobacter sp. WZC-1]|uniref:alpha/beta fold hydrolase n=1 Tax=Acinetobacter sp. WZC-1 TaxID=3459034 RepID=UPI00403DB907
MKKNLLTALLLSSGLLLTACNGSDDGSNAASPSDNTEVNQIQNPVVTTTAYTLTDMSAVATDSIVMTYKMQGVNGNEVQATAQVFTPKTPAPAGGWPIVVWAHGANGVADSCAPSRKVLDTSVEKMIKKLLAQGYVVVAPDYEGLGEPGGQELHPFLNLKSEAYSITDAVVAARNWLGSRASGKWMTVGASQGGHAALGAAQYAARANMDYKGTVVVAPPSYLELIITGGNASVASAIPDQQIPVYAALDVYTAFIAAGLKSNNPTFQYNQAFKSPTDDIAKNAETICLEPLYQQFAAGMATYAASNQTLNGYPRTVDGFIQQPIIRKFLEEDSQPLQVQIKTPIVMYQGLADTTVPAQVTDVLYARAGVLGTRINYIKNAEWTHVTAFEDNIDNIVTNVNDMLSK